MNFITLYILKVRKIRFNICKKYNRLQKYVYQSIHYNINPFNNVLHYFSISKLYCSEQNKINLQNLNQENNLINSNYIKLDNYSVKLNKIKKKGEMFWQRYF